MADTLYSADQIIGKSLVARTQVPITRDPSDGATVVYTAPVGSTIGTVYSYVGPKQGRKNLWWVFYDDNKRAYYAEHIPGRFSTDALTSQGVPTSLQQVQAAQDKNQSTIDKLLQGLGKGGKTILIIAAAYLVARPFLNAGAKKAFS